jgi:hypothetical protein
MPATIPHSAFSNGEKPSLLANTEEKAPLPLKKGGREGFLEKPFSNFGTDTFFVFLKP